MQKFTTFLMFSGDAEEAMTFYTGIFANSSIVNIKRYKAGEPGKEGSVMHATFSLNGQEFMCIDSAVTHAFTFTPAISIYVSFDNEAELDKVFDVLAKGGKVMMPLGAYPFSKKFGWCADKFGVSWQLSIDSKA